MATKSLLGRLSDRIEAIARAIDPDQAVIMVSEELEELFGPRATGSVACEDLLVARHMELFPEDRGADPVEPVFDPRHIELFRLIAVTIALIEEREGKRWNDDASTMFFVLHAVQGVIASLIGPLTKDWTPRERVAHALEAGRPLSETQTDDADSRPTETEDGGKS
jgi:hypothetical protein